MSKNTSTGAPTLGGTNPLDTTWARELLALEPGWDSYAAKPISEAALKAVGRFYVVPRNGGGLQLEIHQDQWDIEVEISADGALTGLYIGQPLAGARSTLSVHETYYIDADPEQNGGVLVV